MRHATARAAGAVGASLLAALLLWPAPASADEASGGRLDWGVKESFRSYITGPIATGEVDTGDGTSTVGDVYRFHSASGDYDPESGTATIDYSGWVHFWGHDGELDVTFADPSIEYADSSGTLYVYVNGTRTDLATLSGPSIAGASGSLAVEGVAATLTANGAETFEGFYEAGEALDPVSFTADLASDDEPTEPAGEPSAEAPDEDEDQHLTGAVLDWGVRDSWREYVSGDLADGSWTASGGAVDGGALFRFTEGEGDADGRDFNLAFNGTVAFTGTDVDLVVADPAVAAADGAAVLSAEVGGERLDLAEFEAELSEQGELLVAQEAPAVLAAEGVEAFGGFYQAGDDMDPISIAVPLSPDAELPALPDLGSEPTGAVTEAAAESEADETESNALLWIVPAAAIVLLAAASVVIALRRRRAAGRRTAESGAAEPDTEASTSPESKADNGSQNTPETVSTEAATEDKERRHP